MIKTKHYDKLLNPERRNAVVINDEEKIKFEFELLNKFNLSMDYLIKEDQI